MLSEAEVERLRRRKAPLEIGPEEFRKLGYGVIDHVAEFLAGLKERPVTPAESPAQVRDSLGAGDDLPEEGTEAAQLLSRAANLLFEHSLFNGHPRFLGYITSSAAPIGALGDLLAAAVNPNVGAWALSPSATEIEVQTIRWIADLVGYPSNCGGLLVSGGNMANFVCFLAARAAKTNWDVRKVGLDGRGRSLRLYASTETHTWIQKATDLFGMGTDSIGWVSTDSQQRLDLEDLRRQIEEDQSEGELLFLVVGTAGSVSTGAVDPLPEIAAICHEYDLWFHVDGAYGAVAAQVTGVSSDLTGISDADSVAVDPHKWLYAPLEAGCVLVRDPESLRNTYSYHPPYYHFGEEVTNYFDFGMQNSRGFRALKVWLALLQVGRNGYMTMIKDDILLAGELYRLLKESRDIEALSHNLSITTFRYVPVDLCAGCGSDEVETYLDRLNQELLTELEVSGELFISNAVVEGKFALRVCVVNFRTSLEDMEAVPEIVRRFGRKIDAVLRNETGSVE